jgi:Fe-S-cluster-containing hydrogenase component 2
MISLSQGLFTVFSRIIWVSDFLVVSQLPGGPSGMKKKETKALTRRDFFNRTALGGGAVIVAGNIGLVRMSAAKEEGKRTMIVADYSKCTGCRTCETVCSASNNKVVVNGKEMDGLGNPNLSNIKVHNYNPDVDVPITCAMCEDAPCIDICPVEPDEKTGRKSLYRDPKTMAVKVDMETCIGCTMCAEECRTGTIVLNSEDKPERMCRLCDGDPQCVKHCPYEALSHVAVDPESEFYAKKPDEIATALIKKWYEREW